MQCVQLPGKLLGGNIKYANAQIWGREFSNFTGGAPSAAKVPISYDDHGHG